MKKYLNELYVIQEGDTLNSIAHKYQVNTTAILIGNNITPNMIAPGYVLYINPSWRIRETNN